MPELGLLLPRVFCGALFDTRDVVIDGDGKNESEAVQ